MNTAREEAAPAARAQARTPRFKQDSPTRSNVERTVAQVATQNGRRVKLRHIGAAANNAWLHRLGGAARHTTRAAPGDTLDGRDSRCSRVWQLGCVAQAGAGWRRANPQTQHANIHGCGPNLLLHASPRKSA